MVRRQGETAVLTLWRGVAVACGVLLGVSAVEWHAFSGPAFVFIAALIGAALLYWRLPWVIVVLTATQNTAIPILWRLGILSTAGASEFLALGEVLVYSGVVGAILYGLLARDAFEFDRVDLLAAAFAIMVLMYLALPMGGSLATRVLAARSLLVIPAYYLLGRVSARRSGSLSRFMGFVVIVMLVSSIGGWVLLIFGASVWRLLDIGAYWVTVKGDPASYILGGIPGNFYRVYTNGIGSLLRLVTLAGDPLASAYQLLLPLFYLPLLPWRRPVKLMVAAALTLTIAATYTRAAYVAVLVGSVVFLWIRGKKLTAIIIVGAASVAALALLHSAAFGIATGSGLGHVTAIESDALYLPRHFLGTGLGGNGGVPAGLPSGENAVAFVYAQVGLVPTALLVGLLIISGKRVWALAPREVACAAAVFVAYMVTGLVSTEWFTDTAMGVYWLWLGLITHQRKLPKAND